MKFKTIVAGLGLLMLQICVLAQTGMDVYGEVFIPHKDRGKVKILVKQNGDKYKKFVLNDSSKFRFELPLQAEYEVTFKAMNYVVKTVEVDLNCPSERAAYPFAPFEFRVNMVPKKELPRGERGPLNPGRIYYISDLDDFDFEMTKPDEQ